MSDDLDFWIVGVRHNNLINRRARIWKSIVWDPVAHTGVEGAETLTELRAITLETLAALLMSNAEFAAGMAELRTKKNHASSEAIRRYWARVTQPPLPEVN